MLFNIFVTSIKTTHTFDLRGTKMFVVTTEEMREMDRLTIESFGIGGLVLMENAGRSVIRMLLAEVPDIRTRRVGVMAGKGNNGGDGFVIARYLAQNGAPVTVYLLTSKEKVAGDAAINLKLIEKMDISIIEIPDGTSFASHLPDLARHDLWVDAILGTGLQSDVRGFFADAINFLNRAERPVYAVDIPSGLNSDTGEVCGVCVKADRTITFGFAKIGQVIYPGIEFVGDLAVADIGIPNIVVDQVAPRHQIVLRHDLASFIRTRPPEMHKGRAGHLLVIGGSPGKTGAAAMTCMAAMRAGAGLVTLGVSKSLNDICEIQLTEAMTAPLPETEDRAISLSACENICSLMEGKAALAIGPGIGTAVDTRQLVRRLLEETSIPAVVDADGLNALGEDIDLLKRAKAPFILTPHPGEMARLVGTTAAEVRKRRIQVARAFASEYNVFLVLKGARTIIAEPGGAIYINPTGNPGMASGGMGDVLTGIIAGFLVQGYSPAKATRLAVYIHGHAADRLAEEKARVGYLAGDIIEALPEEIEAVRESSLEKSSDIPLIQEL